MSAPAAGVDGCPAGWVAAISEDGAPSRARIAVFAAFADLLAALPPDAIVAVDMPIGLPGRVGRGGRGPESLVRAGLGERQSSVFSIPSRAAVYAEPGPFADEPARIAAHRRACEVALATSDPPKKCSIQAFGLFAKIREIDGLLRADPGLCLRVIESHPEAAFRKLNGDRAMGLPKKVRGRVHQPGMEERTALLERSGFDPALLARALPARVGRDDLIDACAMLLVAARHARGETVSFPDPPAVDDYGIPVAIRV